MVSLSFPVLVTEVKLGALSLDEEKRLFEGIQFRKPIAWNGLLILL